MVDGDSLIPLSHLRGFRLAGSAPDVRMWHVHSGDGRRIGQVEDLLVHPGTLEVRFLDVEVENLLVTGRERHVLIPVLHARPHEKQSLTMVVDALTARAVSDLPSYPRGTVVEPRHAEYAAPFAAGAAPAPGGLAFPSRVEAPPVVRVLRPAAPAERSPAAEPRAA